MDRQKDTTLLKARSYRSVLAAGFRLYTENFRRLFKASWQMALLYALSCGAAGTLAAIKLPELSQALIQQMTVYQGVFIETVQQYALTLLGFLALALLSVATLALASAPILSKLKEHKDTGAITTPPHWLTASPHLMGRSLKGIFLTLLVIMIPFCLFAGAMAAANAVSEQFVVRHLVTTIATFALFTIAVLLLALPLYYVLMKYLMEAPCGYWRTLGRSYGRGLRHWGMLFLVFFVSGLLVMLASMIVMTPSNILSFANQQAHLGQLLGDPLGMPSYMTTLTFVTLTLCSFIQFYISQVMLVHNYYIYGSIETKDKEQSKIANV